MSRQALGTLAISSAGGGQEGYDHTDLAASPSNRASYNIIAASHTAIALQELNSIRAANTLSSATTIDVGNIDGAQELNVKETVEQDIPAHDYHVHIETANDTHAKLKRETEAKEIGIMGDDGPAAALAVAPETAQTNQQERRSSLDDLEKTAVMAPTSTVTRTLPAEEKPQTSTIPVSEALPAAVPLPESATSSPKSAQSVTTPALNITLLLPTGARHSFRITESYLTKRGVSIPGVDDKGAKDVFSVNVYQIKELILREWKEEWGGEAGRRRSGEEVASAGEGVMRGKPSSPAAIRLIFFGRLLGDGDKVEDCRFNKASANVVHMTVRPQDVVDEEETERKRNEGRGSRRHVEREETPGCRCVIL